MGAPRQFVLEALYSSRPLLGPAVDGLVGSFINRRRTRFIKPELTLGAFFQCLREREARYVVLRWFDRLPHVAVGHDIDILVADEDVGSICDLLTHWPVGQPIDLYSVGGQPGFDYAPSFVERADGHGMAVFPPHISSRILSRAVLKDDLYRVPNAEDHFFSLAYHATYLKGPHSGLRSRSDPTWQPKAASHDYGAVLGTLAERAGLKLPADPTHEDLDDLLAAHGWRPPSDTLERVLPWSGWLQERLASQSAEVPDGLATFLIRDLAVRNGLKEPLLNAIRLRGFEPLLVKDLSPDESARLATETRGGNWNAGPFPVSGGPPACAVIALDVLPKSPGSEQRVRLEGDNERVKTAKDLIRRWVNRQQASGSEYNPVHSSDNKRQAWNIIQMCAPAEAAAIADMAQRKNHAFHRHSVHIADLTRLGNRSRVSLIEWRGQRAVRKTFKPHCQAFHRREAEALQALAGSPAVPRLLATEKDSVVLEYVEDAWRGRPPLMLPLRVVRQLAEFLKFCVSLGYDPIDLLPSNNLLLDRSGQLKIVDFEFCLKREEAFRPEASYCLSGIPKGFKGDCPFGVDYIFAPYGSEWFGYTGLRLKSFLYAPLWWQRIERAVNLPLVLIKCKLLPSAKDLVRGTSLARKLQSLRMRYRPF